MRWRGEGAEAAKGRVVAWTRREGGAGGRGRRSSPRERRVASAA